MNMMTNINCNRYSNCQTIGIVSDPQKIRLNEYRITKNCNTNEYIYFVNVSNANNYENDIIKQLDPYYVRNYTGQKTEWIKLGIEKIIGIILYIVQDKPYMPMEIDKCGWSNL